MYVFICLTMIVSIINFLYFTILEFVDITFIYFYITFFSMHEIVDSTLRLYIDDRAYLCEDIP